MSATSSQKASSLQPFIRFSSPGQSNLLTHFWRQMWIPLLRSTSSQAKRSSRISSSSKRSSLRVPRKSQDHLPKKNWLSSTSCLQIHGSSCHDLVDWSAYMRLFTAATESRMKALTLTFSNPLTSQSQSHLWSRRPGKRSKIPDLNQSASNRQIRARKAKIRKCT